MAKGLSRETLKSSQRLGSGLVAMGSAAVLLVYSAGYLRTRTAAQRIAEAESQPRVAMPSPLRETHSPAIAEPVAEVAPASRGGDAPPTIARPANAVRTPSPEPSTRADQVRAVASTADAPSSLSVPALAAAPVAPPGTTGIAIDLTPPTVETSAPAEVSKDAPAAAPKPDLLKDGTFSGWGTSRHGDIQATVVIQGGRIVSAAISGCYTRYPCSLISPLPPEVVSRQSAEVDFVSGATQSTYAFYYAVLEALSKAK